MNWRAIRGIIPKLAHQAAASNSHEWTRARVHKSAAPRLPKEHSCCMLECSSSGTSVPATRSRDRASVGRRWAPCSSRRVPHAPLHTLAAPQAASRQHSITAQNNNDDYHPSQGWQAQSHHPSKAQLWELVRREAWNDAAAEPALASFLYSTILSHSSFESALAFLLANKLANNCMGSVQLMGLFRDVYGDEPSVSEAAMADMLAVRDRDPACDKYSQCMLYFKGYQAIQAHRVAHWLWGHGRQALAIALQSRVSEVLHVDIHPAAPVGRGVLLDHASGVVIGETASVGDNVSMLHHVTLGGSGTGKGKRHPSIGNGVLLGAGTVVLGPISVGAGSKVGAGSVVITELPSFSVAVGVPAKVIKRELAKEPVVDMDQCSDFLLDYII